MELIEVILSKENLNRAYKKVVANKGTSGVDGVTVEELGDYIRENKDAVVTSIRNRTYMPKPVRRVYIPKDNGKQRPLGIPTALDRTIQQAIAQPISDIYEEIFSNYSYGFRPVRSCHDAIRLSITLKFCTFFTLKKCTDITVFSLRVIHLFPLVDNFHQQSLLLWNDEGFYQVLPLIWYYLGICPAILRSFCLL